MTTPGKMNYHAVLTTNEGICVKGTSESSHSKITNYKTNCSCIKNFIYFDHDYIYIVDISGCFFAVQQSNNVRTVLERCQAFGDDFSPSIGQLRELRRKDASEWVVYSAHGHTLKANSQDSHI